MKPQLQIVEQERPIENLTASHFNRRKIFNQRESESDENVRRFVLRRVNNR